MPHFVFALEALAQQGGELPPPPGFSEVLFRMLPMLIMVFFIFYFLVIRPQQTKIKAQESMIKGLKKGDRVVTTGGIIARVSGVFDDHVLLEIANGVRVKFQPAKIIQKLEGGESAA